LATFEYKAMTSNGRMISSKMTMDGTAAQASAKLKAMGLKPISVKKKNFDLGEFSNRFRVKPQNKRGAIGLNSATLVADQDFLRQQEMLKSKANTKKTWKDVLMGDVNIDLPDLTAFLPISIEEVISFTEMFLLLKKSNFTNIRAIQTLYNNSENQAMKSILGDMIAGMETGSYIYRTLEYYPKVFPEIYTNLIKVGETTGSLINSLEQALKYLQDSTRIKRMVKKALTGPLVQSALLIIMGILCIIFGLPVMQDMYASYGLTDQIPPETMAAANFIYWCGDHWYLILAIIVGAVILFNVWKRTTAGKYAWDKFKLHVPVFGPLIMRLQIQKFFVAVNINLKNNARLQDAITDCKTVVTNDVIRAAIEAAEANLIVGDSWIEPFEHMKGFPPMIQEMLRIGMETDMPTMIENILQFIDEDIRITIDRITKTLPSVSMIFMGVIIIGFVIIILKPIMEVYMGSFIFEANGIWWPLNQEATW